MIPKLKILFVNGSAKGEKFLLEPLSKQNEEFDMKMLSVNEQDNSYINIIELPNGHPVMEGKKSHGMKYFQLYV